MTPSLRRTATVGTTAVLGLSLALAGAVSPALAATSEAPTDVATPAVTPSPEATTEAVETETETEAVGGAAVGAAAGGVAVADEAAPTDAPSPEATEDAAPSAAPSASAKAKSERPSLLAGSDKYELAAAYSGSSADELRRAEAAGAIKVSENGFVLHIDDAKTTESSPSAERRAAPLGAAIPGDADGGSRPGAPVTVYLDFDGEVLTGTNWNIETDSESLTIEPAALANAAFQEAVWALVAEDYAPFNVNVTTTDPGDDALFKTSAGDNTYGSHVIVTDSYDDVIPEAFNTSGLAWGGGTGSDFLRGAFVFTEGLGGVLADAKSVGDTASHESGHNFGLEHDGIAGSTTGEYYVPTEGVWAPIMGASFEAPLGQWSNGGYAGATQTEDDLAIITDRSAAEALFLSATTADGQPYEGLVCAANGADPENPRPGDVFYTVVNDECTTEQLVLNFTYVDRADYAADEVGNTVADAATLENDGTFTAAGVIERTNDVDVYGVIAAAGEFTATVDVADIAPNLDSKLTLTDADGTVIAESAPLTERASVATATGLGASITATVETGAYFLTVDGVGEGNPANATPENANGYTDYGSLGNYTLAGSAVEFVAEELVIETPADGSEVVGGSEVEVTGTATPGVTVTLTVGGQVVTTTADDETGAWTAAVTANAYGNTEIVASQGFDSIEIPGTASVTVTAPVDEPVIANPANGTTTSDVTPTISGTGIAGAIVTVTVTDANGNATTGEATVNEAGTWELTLGTEFAAGTYTVTAVQAINGVTSDAATAVSFAVLPPANTGGDNDGPGNSNNNNNNSLAATGSDVSMAPFALLAAGLLLGGVFATAFAIRRRKLSLDS